jgi:hypothetical protein
MISDAKCIQNFERPMRRYEKNVKMYLNELTTEGAEWIRLATDRVGALNTVINSRVS